jgi:hypothetical protein
MSVYLCIRTYDFNLAEKGVEAGYTQVGSPTRKKNAFSHADRL